MSIADLKSIMDRIIRENKTQILSDINRFLNSKDKYWNKEYPYLQLILRKGGNEKLKTIGFPFPLISYPLNLGKELKDLSISLCLRGKPLRDFQRNELIDELKRNKKVSFTEIDNIERFRELTKNLCKKYKSCDYFDPYSFIGDSFIGLYFIQNFADFFNLKIKTIYSENYLNLVKLNSRGYSDLLINKKNLAVFSDLIDTHWERTKHLAKNLALEGISSVIIGRNLLILSERDLIRVYHYNKEEPLLKEENIEDYMNDCLSPFLSSNKNKFIVKKILSKNLVINPFGSEEIKTIPEEITFRIIRNFKNRYPDSKILIIAGFRTSFSHLTWCAKLKARLAGNEGIIFKNYGSFSEIEKDLNKYKISLGITADTSIAHLFNWLGIRNITFYNLNRCDLNSPQSLASDSPLGFCRSGPVQFPALFYKNKNLVPGISEFIEYFFGDRTDLGWTKKIFDKKMLISRINKKYSNLLKANDKINPVNKI